TRSRRPTPPPSRSTWSRRMPTSQDSSSAPRSSTASEPGERPRRSPPRAWRQHPGSACSSRAPTSSDEPSRARRSAPGSSPPSRTDPSWGATRCTAGHTARGDLCRRYTDRMSTPTVVDTSAETAQDRLARAKEASRAVARLTSSEKGAALEAIARAIEENVDRIVAANGLDIARGRDEGIGDALIDRLRLDELRVASHVSAVRDVAALPDPIGQVVGGHRMPNGVALEQVRVPFGVVGAIYEARPNVTVDIAALALRAGNAVVLRGGSAARDSNTVLVDVMRGALQSVGVDPEAIQTVDDFGRDGARALMHGRGFIDVLVPRGSASLIETVVTESTVPVIETGAGVVHIVLDESAPVDWARDIVVNAKVQ